MHKLNAPLPLPGLLFALVGALCLSLPACGDDAVDDGGATGGVTGATTDTADPADGGFTAPDQGGVGVDIAGPPPGATDPLSRSGQASLSSHARSGAVVTTMGADVIACNDSALEVLSAADAAATGSVPLSGRCVAVAADDSGAVAATDDGQWHRLEAGASATSASVAGPVPLGLQVSGGVVVASLGTLGLATAPADLSAAPQTIAGLTDARDALPLTAGGFLVADGLAGVKMVDPAADSAAWPKLDVGGLAIGLAPLGAGTDRVVVAVSGFGIVVIDTAGGLTKVGELMTKGIALDVAVDGNYALVADWVRALLIDLTDPAAPKRVAREPFGGDRAASVTAAGGAFFAAGTFHVTRLTPAPAVMVSELRLDRDILQVEVLPQFGEGGAGVLIYNDGRAPLEITNMQTDSPRVAIGDLPEPGGMTLEPDDAGFVELTIQGADHVVAHFTFETNDPDHASVALVLDVNPVLLKVGDPAPEVIMPTVAGPMFRLSEMKGQVAHLKLFNAL